MLTVRHSHPVRRWTSNRPFRSALLLAACFTALASLAPSARAGNPISVGTLALSANFNTIGFQLGYTGDDNTNATVLVRYWRSSQSITSADTAVVPMRDPGSRFIGVIFWLDEGTSYHVRADVTDPDGGGMTVEGTVTTQVPATSAPPDSIRWISPTGNDSNTGRSQGSPMRTVAAALASLSGPGQIRALPGTYYEQVSLNRSGSAGNYYSLVGAGNPDSVIFDESDSTRLHATWTSYGSGIWYLDRDVSTALSLVVANVDQRLHSKSSLNELIDPSLGTDCQNSHGGFPQAGFCRDGNRVYVRLEGNADPNATTMHIAKRDFGIDVTGTYCRVESLTVRYANIGAFNIGHDYGGNPHVPATGAVIRNCIAFDNGGADFRTSLGTNGVLIDSCRAIDSRIGGWSYTAVKCHPEENAVGAMLHGSNNVFRNNLVQGLSNGVGVTSGDAADVSEDVDIYHNTIQTITDDAIEVDSGLDVNMALWGNYIAHAIHAFSAVPDTVGPIYVLYNVFNDCPAGGIKEGDGNDATVYYYNNTFTSGLQAVTIDAVGGYYKNQVFRNNIMVGKDTYVVRDGGALMDVASASLDYDLEYRTDSDKLWYWNSADRTILFVRDNLHWEQHGIVHAPAYYDSTTGNFHPTATSAVIDSGCRIQGINTPYLTRNNNRLYTGNAPDIGAFEYGLVTVAQPLDRPDIYPPAVASLQLDGHCTSIDVQWTAPGDDGSVGTAHHYDLRMSDSNITDSNFGSATPISTGSPGSPGTQESVNVSLGLCSGTKYFALKTVDEVGNTSALSNVPYGGTPCTEFCDDGGAPTPLEKLAFALAEPAPNPAGGPAELRFSIPARLTKAPLELGAFDPLGRRIRTIEDTRPAQAGRYSVTWDLRDARGHSVPNGIYYLRLRVGHETLMRTLLVLR